MSRHLLDNATAFITGGAQGIGFGIAQALAYRGVKLALADVDEVRLRTAREVLSASTQVETHVLDVRDRDGFARAADLTEARLGPVKLLFNNAGVAGGAPVDEIDYPTWDFFVDVNVNGVVNGLQTFLPRMIARGECGYVVNTASGAGLAGMSGYLYTMTKFAVVGLSESLRVDLEEWGIGVSVLCPGPVATSILTNTVLQQQRQAQETKCLSVEAVEETEATLAQGVTPSAVGEMVVEAMLCDRLYIHTDDIMAEPVRARTEAILAAMPSVLGSGVTSRDESAVPV